jgi:hypothetical protein
VCGHQLHPDAPGLSLPVEVSTSPDRQCVVTVMDQAA